MTAELQAASAPAGPPGARRVAANSTAQLLTFTFRAASSVGVVVLLARSGGPVHNPSLSPRQSLYTSL